MISLFVDNFRGFESQWIHLKKVNFFVGENSTGKSSIIYLVYLLESINNSLEFNTDEINLGSFSESLNFKRKSEPMTICMVKKSNKSTGNSGYQCAQYTLINSKGVAKIRKLAYNHDKNSYLISIVNNSVNLYFRKDVWDDGNFDNPEEFYNRWVNDDDFTVVKKDIKEHGKRLLPAELNFLSLDFYKTKIERFWEIKMPTLTSRLNPILGVAPLRAKPKRYYESSQRLFNLEGDHVPYVLKEVLGVSRKTKHVEQVISLLREFGKESGMFQNIRTKSLGSGGMIFELLINDGHNEVRISNTGYGLSQVLPILTLPLTKKAERPIGQWISIQQPEVHLHPRAQVAMGGLFFTLAHDYGYYFIIETHSDYLIDSFRRRIKESKMEDELSQVLFFKKTGPNNYIYSIPIDSQGKYKGPSVDMYREFFVSEAIDNIYL